MTDMTAPRRLGTTRRTPLVCTTCSAMHGNGRRIAITTVTMVRLPTAQPGQLELAAVAALSAVVPGTSFRGTSVPPVAAGSPPGTTSAVSASPGRLYEPSQERPEIDVIILAQPLRSTHPTGPGQTESRCDVYL